MAQTLTNALRREPINVAAVLRRGRDFLIARWIEHGLGGWHLRFNITALRVRLPPGVPPLDAGRTKLWLMRNDAVLWEGQASAATVGEYHFPGGQTFTARGADRVEAVLTAEVQPGVWRIIAEWCLWEQALSSDPTVTRIAAGGKALEVDWVWEGVQDRR